MNNKKLGICLFIALIALVSGISYAYFTASFQNLGTRETSITLAELGSLKLTATEATYTSGEQYPGDIAIQKFYVEPVTKGKGVYELDLTGVIDETIFGSDVEIQLYKSLDNTEVTVTEGELTQDGSNFSRVDTLVTNGLTPVYTGSLKNGLNILYQEEFEVIEESGSLKVRENSTSTSYPKYTFYLVYNYKNNGNQNSQMGQTFNGTISGKLIKEKKLTGAETIAKLVEGSDSTSTAVIDNGEVLDGEDVLCTNTLAYDDYGNLRYVGANPCNYVTFNNEAPAMVDAYQAYLDGAIPTDYTEGEYDTEEACMADIEDWVKEDLGIEETLSCSLNTSNNKYEIVGHAYLNALGKQTTQSSCSNKIDTWGLTSSTITCRKNGKMATGGWRVIGIIDGKIKLIRNESIGGYSWDTSASNVNGGDGINQWGESGDYKGADLMKLLNPGYENNMDSLYQYNSSTYAYDLVSESALVNNSLYWNHGAGNCYNEWQNAYTTCDFSTTGLSDNAKSMIASTIWHLGSNGSNDVLTSGNGLGLASKFYEYERSNNNGKICSSGSWCNDTVNRTTTWEGYVGLMSPSDYGYAVGGEVRANCLANTNLYDNNDNIIFIDYGTNDCYTNDWLFNSTVQWTMSPIAASSNACYVFIVRSDGYVNYDYVAYDYFVRPALFLISDIEISGEGTPTDPFTLSVN